LGLSVKFFLKVLEKFSFSNYSYNQLNKLVLLKLYFKKTTISNEIFFYLRVKRWCYLIFNQLNMKEQNIIKKKEKKTGVS
jgi:hypothetical protein